MNRLQKIEQGNKFQALPVEIKLLLGWVDWLHYDLFNTGSSETYHDYTNAINWIKNELFESYGIDEMAPSQVNEENFTGLWFKFDMNFDKESLLEMDSDREYEIKLRGSRYAMVEVSCYSALPTEKKNRLILYNYLLRKKTELGQASKWSIPYLGYLIKNNLDVAMLPKKYDDLELGEYKKLMIRLGVDASVV